MSSGASIGIAAGTPGSQRTLEQGNLERKAKENEERVKETSNHPPTYKPSPKHDKGGFGTENPIKTKEEGQKLLDTGYQDGKQIYNITSSGKIVVFQPDNTPENGYHSYEVDPSSKTPPNVLKQMVKDGKLTNSERNKIRKNIKR